MDNAKVTTVPIDALQPEKRNARKRGAKAKKALRRSLDTFGAGRSVVLDGTDTVRAGNGTIEQAKAAGFSTVIVVEPEPGQLVAVKRSDWTPEQAEAYGLADNQTATLAEWQPEILDAKIEALPDSIPIDALGFEAGELDRLLGRQRDLQNRDRPAAPTKPKSPISRTGDTWTLGDHRLMVGDSTSVADVCKLIDGEPAELCFTDPPYGVVFGSAKKNAISGDLTQATIPLSFAVMIEHATDANARIYMCGGQTNFVMYQKLFEHHAQMDPRVIVWVKQTHVMRQLNYHARFEFIYWGWKGAGGGPKFWQGDRKDSDVWEVEHDQRERTHPTQKPVELAARAMRNHSRRGGVVFEPFAGSGSTLIACEENGRRCRAMEVDPGFCDLVVQWWEALTGGKATRSKG